MGDQFVPIPHRWARAAILFLYVILCYVVLLLLLGSDLPVGAILLIAAFIFAGSVPLWFGMQRMARKGMPPLASMAATGSTDPLGALDETDAGRVEEGPGNVSRAAAQPIAKPENQGGPSPRPEPPQSAPALQSRIRDAKYVKVQWTRTQKLEGYLLAQGVRVLEQSDTDVEVVKGEEPSGT
jgi:hypothetical protein